MATPETNQTLQRCRTIRPSGHRCQNAALSGHEQCFIHGRDRRRLRNVKYSPAVIEIPLLDNYAAIQIVCTDVARALAAGTIDHATARLLMSTVRVAAQCLPRPVAHKASSKSGKDEAEPPEPVSAIVTTPEGEELAPPAPYSTREEKEEKKEKPWSFARYLYHQMHPEKVNAPLPPEGYLDPNDASPIRKDEISDPAAPSKPLQQTAGASQNNPPPPQPGILPELTAVAECSLNGVSTGAPTLLRTSPMTLGGSNSRAACYRASIENRLVLPSGAWNSSISS